MAIRTIREPDIYVSAADKEVLRREWEASQQYTTMPKSFETWLRGRLANRGYDTEPLVPSSQSVPKDDVTTNALKKAQAALRGLSFKDTNITDALDSIERALRLQTGSAPAPSGCTTARDPRDTRPLQFGGCPSCGRASCVALSCTRETISPDSLLAYAAANCAKKAATHTPDEN